jgi:CDP-paratose 2-epimerase
MTIAFRRILASGGAGFVGSNLAVWLRRHCPEIQILAPDDLKRRGSELKVPRLRVHDVKFIHADIRNPEDLELGQFQPDVIIECSAEPRALVGYGDALGYVVNTNLLR